MGRILRREWNREGREGREEFMSNTTMQPPPIITLPPPAAPTTSRYSFTLFGTTLTFTDLDHCRRERESEMRRHYSRAVDFFIAIHLFGFEWYFEYGQNHLAPAWKIKEQERLYGPKGMAERRGRKMDRKVNIWHSPGDSSAVLDYENTGRVAYLTAALSRRLDVKVEWTFGEDLVVVVLKGPHFSKTAKVTKAGEGWEYFSDPVAMGRALRRAVYDYLVESTGTGGDPAATLFEIQPATEEAK